MIRILSQNLLSKDGDSEHPELKYINRKEDLFALVGEIQPDLVCFQETTVGWKALLSDERFSDYEYVGEGRDGKGKGEHNLVCWRKDKFTYISDRTFWLTSTPDRVSRALFSGCRRICTFAHLRENASGREFVLACTHLDHKSAYARHRNADSLMANLKGTYTRFPFIMCGDFNSHIGSYAYRLISADLHDVYTIARDAVPYVTFHAYGKYSGNLSPIDFIYVNDSFGVDRYRVLNSKGQSGNYISDHYGVLTDVYFKEDDN